ANTAMPLALAGHAVTLVAAVGSDAAGRRLLAELAAAEVDAGAVKVIEGAATTRSVIMVETGGERTIVNLHRTTEPEPPVRLVELPADWLYVRSRALNLAPLLAEKAKYCRVIAHIPPCAAGARPAHVVVGSASDLTADALADPWQAAKAIAGDLLEWVVVTRGAWGAVAYDRDGRQIERRARRVNALDTTGAGDSFAAGLIHGLASGRPIEAALDVAIAWGTEAVLSEGSQLPAAAVARLLGS
ncbi:MAG: bifunctional hydroxymethylpyrimidine kinase/phosphomethylpyrimidine kinase, partial [Rhodospirillales bacterium]|nr:bifunctional hydroxymethylpyrimidine kinase/phosphomethylpyrimidine kinase [Rhodospirillales bacterium]